MTSHSNRALTFCITLLLWCSAGWLHAAPVIVATLDRNSVTQGDALTLTIRINDTGSYAAPDFSALEPDFQVLGSNQNSQHVISNGRAQSFTEWQTTLLPKRSGRLTIPAIAVAGSSTRPLVVEVSPADPNTAQDSSEPLFMQVQVDRDSVYVQQQLLLTVRIFHSVPLDNMQVSEPEFDNASVRKAQENSFRREIDGVTYLVHELNYAIFPQQAGALTIPEIVFSGTQSLRSRTLFDFPGQGRLLRKMSQQLKVTVKPIPTQFSGPVWLPARNLTLAESWGGNPQQLSVGESITRSIIIRADGLQAAQLPALALPKPDNAKLYGDQPTLEDEQDAKGVRGKRIESAALIPARAGSVQLPAVKVVWWDLDSDSEKTATLPAQTLAIKAGAAGAETPATAPPPAAAAAAPGTATAAATAAPAATWWPLLTALFALAWVLTLFLYWRLRRAPRAPATAAVADEHRQLSEDRAFRAVVDACRADDAAASRRSLIAWAKVFYGERGIDTLDQLARRSGDAEFAALLRTLDAGLFGAAATTWKGEELLKKVRHLRSTAAPATAAAGLPPLYPAA